MNEIIQALHTRKSVRVFTDEPVGADVKREILAAAAQAPTAGCQQLYTILDITDQRLKTALADTCDHQSFIAKAPLVLIFCADCRRWYDAYLEAGCTPRKPGPGELMLAVSDTNIAAQNAVTASESLGLGSCYIGDIMELYEVHRSMLNLPEYVFPAAMLVIGHPTAQQQARPKPPRFDLKYIVHENAYHHLDGHELREMFDGKTDGKDFDAWIAAFCKRKYNSDFSEEMSRSTWEYWKQFRGDRT